MRRIIETPRSNFESLVKNDGLNFYDLQGLMWGVEQTPDHYWTEEGSIEITA